MVRGKNQLTKIIEKIKAKPGMVLYTMVNYNLRKLLKQSCQQIPVPCISILARAVRELESYLNVTATPVPGKQHETDDNYFTRIDAINFALKHDDGMNLKNANEADIIIVGVSRTSKSPISVYLAYKGYKALNIPFIEGQNFSLDLTKINKPLFIGLTIDSENLAEIRKNRDLGLDNNIFDNYVNQDRIEQELATAYRFFSKNGWQIIDVTKKSVEEVAASIIQIYNEQGLNLS